jgi:predicted porin
LTAVNSGTNTTSRLGFRAMEYLGGELKATFKSQSRINVDRGQR